MASLPYCGWGTVGVGATKRVAVGSGAVRGVVRARDLGLEEGAHGPLGVRPGRAVS
jgi:hypothetical protein